MANSYKTSLDKAVGAFKKSVFCIRIFPNGGSEKYHRLDDPGFSFDKAAEELAQTSEGWLLVYGDHGLGTTEWDVAAWQITGGKLVPLAGNDPRIGKERALGYDFIHNPINAWPI